ncbi:MAG: glycosyltransferase, partial [Balneolaceae bacterium]
MPVAVDVITVCYQSAATLERCIDSVRRSKQAIANYIIIDGGSTDGTLEIIQKHQDFIDHWVSENDDGIADAFNKGISIAVSPYILLLNSDDYLLDGALERVVSQILPDDQIIMTPVSRNIQGIEIETKTSNPARIR